MDPDALAQNRLNRIRGWRNRRERDLTLGFLQKQFKHEVERPYKQLADVIKIWDQAVPARYADSTRLESLRHGTLTITVDSSSLLYAIDRLLRNGLEARLRAANRGRAVNRVRLRVRTPRADHTTDRSSQPQ